MSEISLVQARARVERLSVEKIDLSPEVGLEIARANRFDWMNNRAALVDTWRLIEYNGNRLESNVDVFVNGNLGTVGDNPVRFGTDNSSLQFGVRFDAPFNRLQERNDFRQQLVVYQQGRRQLIQFEDTVHRTIRQLLRDAGLEPEVVSYANGVPGVLTTLRRLLERRRKPDLGQRPDGETLLERPGRAGLYAARRQRTGGRQGLAFLKRLQRSRRLGAANAVDRAAAPAGRFAATGGCAARSSPRSLAMAMTRR